jgi:hypothetical protein
MKGCTAELNNLNDHKINQLPALNETVETSVISTCLSVACLYLKTDRTKNMLMHIESVKKRKHRMWVKIIFFDTLI